MKEPSRTDLRRLAVSIVTRIFSPEPSAASFRLSSVANALGKAGADVTVLTSKYSNSPGLESSATGTAGARITISRWPVIRDAAGYVRGYLPYLSFDLPLAFRIARRKADIVLVEPPPTTGSIVRLVTFFLGRPYVWYAADVWADGTRIAGAPRMVVACVELLEKFAVRGAAGVIAVSEGVAERVRQMGATNVEVIPNGIDTDVYNPDVIPFGPEELKDMGIVGPYALYAGTASEWQEAEIFAAAMERVSNQVPDLQLVYVGQGSRFGLISELAETLNAKTGKQTIVMLPQAKPDKVARLLRGAEISLVSIAPGKGYDFAYPTKVLAAAACGTPVLYSGVGAVAQDVRENHLGLCAAHEVNSVAQAIVHSMNMGKELPLPADLRNWVLENRSLQAMSVRAAQFIVSCASQETNAKERISFDSD